MANPKKRLPENVPGDFFVDSTCIDCDTCRQIAPAVFAEGGSVRLRPPSANDGCQPTGQALHALVSCPTGSIGSTGRRQASAVMDDFPLLIEEPRLLLRLQLAEVLRRQQLLHPAPRGQLADRLAEVPAPAGSAVRGAGRHRPHLPDAPRRRGRCPALRRAIRQHALHPSGRTVVRSPDAEVVLDGGDCAGTGSGLPGDPDARPHGGPLRAALRGPRFSSPATIWTGTATASALAASRDYCWYSWPHQTDSMARLADYRFEWVLPGHGQRVHLPAAAMRRADPAPG